MSAGMNEAPRIRLAKQPMRPHYIPEWAARRFKNQAELARAIGADKSVVSRWFDGATPGEAWQKRLAATFDCTREALFRHPDEQWVIDFLAGRCPEEIERIKATLEFHFPRQPR